MMEAKEMFLNDSAFIYPLVTLSFFLICVKVLGIPAFAQYPHSLPAFTHYPHLFIYFLSPYFTS